MNDKILVVVDVQNDFVTGSLGNPAAVAAISHIRKKILGFDGIVLATLDTHGEDYLETQEGRLLPVVHCQKYSHGWFIEPTVYEALFAKSYKEIIKDTFGSCSLMDVIYESAVETGDEEIKEIILIGLATDICIITNALILKTAYPEITITVDASCCAGTTPENHAAALQVMRSCQVNVIYGDHDIFDVR